MFFFQDPLGLLLFIPPMLFALYAQARVRSAYEKYSRVSTVGRLTGAQAAQHLLREAGLDNVRVEMTRGMLTDHYDPRNQVVRLSSQVYGESSLAALGIAAHEVGHAVQHDHDYIPLSMRNRLFPMASIGSQIAMPLFLIGLIFAGPLAYLMEVGIAFFIFAVLFQAITLPVEFNASSRALQLLESGGLLQGRELAGAKQVLNAAALTYVAAMAVALTQLIRLLILRGNRR